MELISFPEILFNNLILFYDKNLKLPLIENLLCVKHFTRCFKYVIIDH